jgi:hypothetical protein
MLAPSLPPPSLLSFPSSDANHTHVHTTHIFK